MYKGYRGSGRGVQGNMGCSVSIGVPLSAREKDILGSVVGPCSSKLPYRG